MFDNSWYSIEAKQFFSTLNLFVYGLIKNNVQVVYELISVLFCEKVFERDPKIDK